MSHQLLPTSEAVVVNILGEIGHIGDDDSKTSSEEEKGSHPVRSVPRLDPGIGVGKLPTGRALDRRRPPLQQRERDDVGTGQGALETRAIEIGRSVQERVVCPEEALPAQVGLPMHVLRAVVLAFVDGRVAFSQSLSLWRRGGRFDSRRSEIKI